MNDQFLQKCNIDRSVHLIQTYLYFLITSHLRVSESGDQPVTARLGYQDLRVGRVALDLLA
jgi:hypothetical protein